MWNLLSTPADGVCGFKARALIAGLEGDDPELWIANLSQMMRDRFRELQDKKVWLDLSDLIPDLIQQDYRFGEGVVWIRSVAIMAVSLQDCCVTLRANRFRMTDGFPAPVPDVTGV